MDKGAEFRALHVKGVPLLMPNAWDIGSAKVLAALGAKAIATSSAAHAFTLGRPDMGTVTRDEALAHAQNLVRAVNVPVSGDFENGFGGDPDTVAETVRMAAEIGLAGISIEDTALPSIDAYAFEFSVERIKAACAAARALPKDFVLCARADGVMNGAYEIDEAIKRAQAFEAAGADCIFVPVPQSFDDLARICKSVQVPVNVVIAGAFRNYKATDFAKIGIARMSLGSSLARVTHAALINSACDALNGDFSALLGAAKGSDVDALLG